MQRAHSPDRNETQMCLRGYIRGVLTDACAHGLKDTLEKYSFPVRAEVVDSFVNPFTLNSNRLIGTSILLIIFDRLVMLKIFKIIPLESLIINKVDVVFSNEFWKKSTSVHTCKSSTIQITMNNHEDSHLYSFDMNSSTISVSTTNPSTIQY